MPHPNPQNIPWTSLPPGPARRAHFNAEQQQRGNVPGAPVVHAPMGVSQGFTSTYSGGYQGGLPAGGVGYRGGFGFYNVNGTGPQPPREQSSPTIQRGSVETPQQAIERVRREVQERLAHEAAQAAANAEYHARYIRRITAEQYQEELQEEQRQTQLRAEWVQYSNATRGSGAPHISWRQWQEGYRPGGHEGGGGGTGESNNETSEHDVIEVMVTRGHDVSNEIPSVHEVPVQSGTQSPGTPAVQNQPTSDPTPQPQAGNVGSRQVTVSRDRGWDNTVARNTSPSPPAHAIRSLGPSPASVTPAQQTGIQSMTMVSADAIPPQSSGDNISAQASFSGNAYLGSSMIGGGEASFVPILSQEPAGSSSSGGSSSGGSSSGGSPSNNNTNNNCAANHYADGHVHVVGHNCT